jgi:thiosulfate dehydrogenase (quinone) large subunit
MPQTRRQDPEHGPRVTQIPEPPVSRLLFADTRLAWLWLGIRLYLGWVWLVQGGLEKLGDPRWTGDRAGTVVEFFVKGALEKTEGRYADVPGWYAAFLREVVLPAPAFWAYVVTAGEILIGLGLIFGALTGIAAFFGSLLNLTFLLGGTVSWNPMMFVLATWLVMGWRVAGWYGLDRWLLPLFGTPWSAGALARHRKSGRGRPVEMTGDVAG